MAPCEICSSRMVIGLDGENPLSLSVVKPSHGGGAISLCMFSERRAEIVLLLPTHQICIDRMCWHR